MLIYSNYSPVCQALQEEHRLRQRVNAFISSRVSRQQIEHIARELDITTWRGDPMVMGRVKAADNALIFLLFGPPDQLSTREFFI